MKIIRSNTEIMRERQLVIRRELDRRGVSLKAVAYDSGIKYNTLICYFPGGDKLPNELPAGAISALCGALPNDLLNLLLPDGWAIVPVPLGMDYDEISAGCREFLDEKERAHHPESEEGREIGPTERSTLGEKAAKLRIVA